MILRKYISILVLALLSLDGFAQSSTNSQASLTASEILRALLTARDEAAAVTLLMDNKDSITRLVWNGLITEAVKNATAGDNVRALFLLEVSKHVAGQLDQKQLLGYSYYRVARVLVDAGEFKAAIDAYLASKRVFEEDQSTKDVLYVLAELGNLLAFTGDYEKVEQYSQQVLALTPSLKTKPCLGGLPDEYGTAYAWSNLGEASLWQGDFSTALTRFQHALTLWQTISRGGNAYRAHITIAMTNIGICYKMMGIHAEALKTWYRALELARQSGDKARSASVLVSIGVLYSEQRDYSKASDLLNQSLELFTELKNQREIANARVNIGVLNQRLGKYATARESFGAALTIAQEIDALDLVVAAQQGIGTTYYEQGSYSTALQWFDEGLSLALRIGDKIRMAEILWRKGQVYYSQGDYDKASVVTKDAAEVAGRLESPLTNFLALTLLGKIYRAKGQLGSSVGSLTRAIHAIEQMRDQVAGGEKEQQTFFEDKLAPYHEMVAALVEQDHAEEALRFAERAKGRVLLDVLRNGRININTSLTEGEQSEERKLYRQIVSLNTQIRVERMRPQRDDSRVHELEARLQIARNDYEVFQQSLSLAHPDVATKRGQFAEFTLRDADSLMQDSSNAILEYVVTDDYAFLFVLTRDRASRINSIAVRVHSIRIKKAELAVLIERYRELLSTNHPGFRQPSRELYDLLIKPAEPFLRGKSTVCVIPDGPLWNLPFQALQNRQDQYILERYAIYYAPSIQVLREMRKRSRSLQAAPLGKNEARGGRSSHQLYAVGNPSLGGEGLERVQTLRNAPFAPLPETEREVQAIAAEAYSPGASMVRVGVAAGEETVKAEMKNYAVLHFATHGVLDNRDPLYSYIVLAPSTDSKEDGLLEAWELMETHLKADLAVLSACDTARGRVGDGEGIIGLTWALFVAGVPTMVASQWQVPSESTTRLMLGFHKGLSSSTDGRKISKAAAWRQAALATIKDPRYRMKPYYWAGFVVVGDGGR